MRKLLFLSSQFTGYFYECLKELVTHHDFEVQIIRWQTPTNAPFQLSEYQNISIDLKNDFTSKELLEKCLSFQPDLVYYPGWMDRDYLKIVAKLRQKGTISIMGFDNKWQGNIKQRFFASLGYGVFKKIFRADYVWVAGEYQVEYMKRIGVPSTNILFGLYSANQPLFNAHYQQFRVLKTANYPKQFLFLGRFETIKNPMILYQVFENIVAENLNKGWTLTLIGAGAEEAKLKLRSGIEVKKFVQPQDLVTLMPKFGCLVVPSIYEAWGVVVHEAVSAGLPVILSSAVGSNSIFLKEGYNGFSFESQQRDSLKQALLKIINTDDETLMKMSEYSSKLSFQITPKSWSETLISVLHSIV